MAPISQFTLLAFVGVFLQFGRIRGLSGSQWWNEAKYAPHDCLVIRSEQYQHSSLGHKSFIGVPSPVWCIISLDSLFIDLEYPTLYPVHENPYVVGNNEGGGGGGAGMGASGIGYVESNQPFHSKSVRVTPTLSVLVQVISGGMSVLVLLQPQLQLRQHIR